MSKRPKPKAKKTVESPKRSKVSDHFLDQLSSKQIHLLGAGIFALLGIFVFRLYLSGQYFYLFKDIGSDTVNLYWPNFVNTAEYFRNYGLPTWSFHQGMGQNILPYSIGDPFNWIMYLMGPDRLHAGIAWAEFFKVIAAGSFFLAFLRNLGVKNISALIGSLCYAFSGFMILGGTWYIFSSEAVFFALLLWSFELLYQKKQFLLFPLAVCLLGAYNPFDWFTYGLILFFYAGMRHFSESKKPAEFGALLGKMVLFGALGVGISSFLSVSGIIQILNSPRVDGDSSFFSTLAGTGLFSLEADGHYRSVLLRMFSSDLQGTGTGFQGWRNYLESPILYSGLLSLILAPYAFVHASKRERLVYGIFAALFILPVIFPFFRYAFWLFAGNYYRGFSVFVVLGLIYFGIRGLDSIVRGKQANWIVLGSSVLLCLLILFLQDESSGIQGNIRNVIAGILVLQAAALWAMHNPEFKRFAQIGLLVLVGIEVSYLSSITVNNRNPISSLEMEQKMGFNDFTVDAMSFIESQDPGFFRTDKLFNSGPAIHASINDQKIQRFYGTASYNSFNQKHYINFLRDMDVIDATDEDQTRWARGVRPRPLLQVWSSHKYMLNKAGQDFNFPLFKKFQTVGDVDIYRNDYFLDFGFTYDQVTPKSQIESMEYLPKDITIMRSAIIDDSDTELLNQFPRFDIASIPGNYTPQLVVEDINKRREGVFQMTEFKEKKIKGTAQVDQRKLMCFTTPYDKGWSAKVDGKSVPVHKVNIGFIGLVLEPGTHDIELSYTPRYFGLSILISLASLGLWGFLFWRSRKTEPASLK